MKHLSIIFASLIILASFSCQEKQTEYFPAFPPNDVDNALDFKQMLGQLKITLPELPSRKDDPNRPQGSTPSNPDNQEGSYSYNGHNLNRSAWGLWDNYDDTPAGIYPGRDSFRVGKYTPLPILRMKNGKIINTADEWWNKLRPEIAYAVQKELYGFFPPKEKWPLVDFEVKTTIGGNGNGKYVQKELTGIIDVSGYPEVRDKPVITATLRTPESATGPVPVMIVFGGFGRGVEDRYWDIVAPHGWGVCVFSPNTVQPDNGAGLTSYLIGLINKGNWRKPDDWGSIGAWAWAISRLIDYLETDPAVNAEAIGLTGHSRYGKATLFATAFEPRIAIAFPSDAGSLGTKMNRRHWGQDLENSGSPSEYHWMAGNFLQWCGELKPGQYLPRKMEKMTVDAHSLLALCAPRPVLINGGTESAWADPFGMFLTLKNASPAYELLGIKGFIAPDKPEVDVAYIDGTLGYRFHDGGHTDQPEWPTFFEFANKFIDATELSVSSYVILLSSNGKTAEITVKSNKEWKITNNSSWLIIDKLSATGDDVVNVLAQNNSTGQGRSAEFSIEAEGRKLRVIANQASNNSELAVSHKELSFDGKDSSAMTLKIASRSAWNVSSEAEWVSVEPSAGVNDSEIKVSLLPNPLIEKRETIVAVSSPGNIQKVKIVQSEGRPMLQIMGSKDISFGPTASNNSSTFVITNTTCEVISDANWVSGEISRQGMFSRLIIKVQDNKTGQPRSTRLQVRAEGADPILINVTQKE